MRHSPDEVVDDPPPNLPTKAENPGKAGIAGVPSPDDDSFTDSGEFGAIGEPNASELVEPDIAPRTPRWRGGWKGALSQYG